MNIFEYRKQAAKLKAARDANAKRIAELQNQLAAADVTIQKESERCAKAIHENTSSIRYAKRIQSAAFSQKEISGIFSDYFIFTKPHTIVTGDFY
ncbi:MAG: hypothetical protein IKB95_07610, partial [Bacteroidales bacterium]|nr:hypothetical protein [Bacteroidales bacterium]